MSSIIKFAIETRHLGPIEVDFDALAPAVQRYIIAYGLKQSIDDAGADPAKGMAGSQARLAALLKGEVPQGGGGGARLSAFDQAVRDVVEALMVKSGVKRGEAKKAARDPAAAVADMFPKDSDKVAKVLEQVKVAAKKLAEQRKAAVGEIDL